MDGMFKNKKVTNIAACLATKGYKHLKTLKIKLSFYFQTPLKSPRKFVIQYLKCKNDFPRHLSKNMIEYLTNIIILNFYVIL